MKRLPDAIAPTWLVVHVLGTLFIAATLLTARESDPWVWAAYGVIAACWLGFAAGSYWWPKTGAVLLVGASVVAAAVLGRAGDSSAIILCAITVGRFATLADLSVAMIGGIGVLDMAIATASTLAGHGSPVDLFGNAGMLLVLLLIGLNRRQYEVQALQSAALLEQTRLAQAEHARAAALDERTRIARELHDVLAHSLGALGVQLELADALLAEKSDVDGALKTIRRSRRLAAEGLSEARDAVAALRRDILPLADALAAAAGAHERDHRVPVGFAAVGAPRSLPSAVVVSLAGIAREALTNAGKHAPGRPVTMRLTYTEDAVTLEVRNPLPESEVRPKGEGGFGLTGMRERLALAGGTLRSGRDGGEWLVEAEVRA